jgi:hypothetical protein
MLRTKLQKQNDFTGQDFYIGLDVHKQSWYVTIRSLGNFASFSGITAKG